MNTVKTRLGSSFQMNLPIALSLTLKNGLGLVHAWSGGIFPSITSTKHNIPLGHIPKMIPNITEITKWLIERNALRSSSPSDPHIQELNAQIHQNIKNSNRQKWTLTVESGSHKCNPSRLWSRIESVNGRRAETPPNQPVTISFKSVNRNVEIATAFATQFTSTVSHIPYTSDRRKLHLIIWYLASLLILFLMILKTAAILLPLVQMTSPFITSKTWAP